METFAILFILILVFLGAGLVNLMTNTPEEKELCFRHIWSYDPNGKMLCIECKYRPEDNN